VRSVVKAPAAVFAAAVFLAGCSGNSDSSSSPSPLAKAGVTVDESALPTLTGAYGEAPTIAFPLLPGKSSPSPTPLEDEATTQDPSAAASETPADTASETPAAASETPADPTTEATTEATTDPTTDPTTEASEEPSAEPSEGDDAVSPSPSPSPEPIYIDPPTSLQAQVQPGMEGEDEPVKADNLVSVDIIVWEWGEVEPVVSLNTFTSGVPLVMPVRSDNPILVGLSRVIVGQNVGSRVLGVIPPSQGSLAAQLGLDEGATLVVAVDIREQFSKDLQAQADAKPTGAQIGPKISGPLGGAPTISVPADVPEPTDISTTVIATGAGPAVEDHQQILVHYAAVDWAGKADGDTWKDGRGPVAITVTADPYGDGSTLEAFSGLVGIPVGSRVLILTPGKEGSYLAEAVVLDIIAVVVGDDTEDEDDADAAGGDEGAGGDDAAGDAPSDQASAEPDPSPTE
jgi:peptidylprolyl isomerase